LIEGLDNYPASAMSVTTDRIYNLIKDPQNLSSFLQFTVQIWSSENILFFIQVVNWKKQCPKITEAESQKRLHLILDEYVHDGAPLEVCMEFSTKKTLLNRVKAGNIGPDIFDQALEVTLLLLLTEYQAWKRYVKDYKRFELKQGMHGKLNDG